jgi:hypothetical protein
MRARKVDMNSNNRHRVLFLILFFATLAGYGCVGTAPVTPSPTVPAATATPSPKPTDTKVPTPDDVATAHFIVTGSINDIVATVQPMILASYPSPDGKWRVDIIRYDCMDYPYQDYVGSIAYEQLKIVNLSDGTEQIVEDQLQSCGGVGAFGLDGLYWSPSNRYFYYSDWREGTPDGGCGSYLSLPIYRLDTVTEEIITIGGSHISPDQTKLAMWQKSEIVIGDIHYSVIFWGDTQPGDKSAWYIENQSLIGYDYSPGLPILTVQASASDWERCKALAEKVLATLRVP